VKGIQWYSIEGEYLLKMHTAIWQRRRNNTMSKINLRPHHLLCIQKYTGHGYDENFTNNMNKLVEAIRTNPDYRVELVEGGDRLCASCPNFTEGKCKEVDKVKSMDEKVLKVCEFSYGDADSWNSFAKVAAGIFDTPQFEEICGTCQWAELCRNTRIM
jgi:hypothetical protein